MRRLARSWLRGPLAWVLACAMCLAMVVPPDAAAESGAGAASGAGRMEDLATVQRVLEQDAVRDRLRALGLGEAEVAARLARLDDGELRELAARLDELAPGGQSGPSCQDGGCAVLALAFAALLVVALLAVLVEKAVKWLQMKLKSRPA